MPKIVQAWSQYAEILLPQMLLSYHFKECKFVDNRDAE